MATRTVAPIAIPTIAPTDKPSESEGGSEEDDVVPVWYPVKMAPSGPTIVEFVWLWYPAITSAETSGLITVYVVLISIVLFTVPYKTI